MGALAARACRTNGAIRFEPDPDGGQRVLLEGRRCFDRDPHPAHRRGREQGERDPRACERRSLDMQRAAGAEGGVVLEGRDIGSVVFPDAEAKFFLTASVEVRAERRVRELSLRGEPVDAQLIRREVAERDHRDSVRAVAPLRQAEGALLVDSSGLPIDEVVSTIVRRVREVEAELGRSK